MAEANLEIAIRNITAQEAWLTNEITDIMTDKYLLIDRSSDLGTETQDKKEALKAQYDYDTSSTGYQSALDDINSDYELALEEISNLEEELDLKKEEIEVDLNALGTTKENYVSILGSNIEESYTYCQDS